MCLTEPLAKRRAVGAAFAACDELPALIVSGTVLFVSDWRYEHAKMDGVPGLPKVAVLDCLRLTSRDFKTAVDGFVSEWMKEAVSQLQSCREAFLLDRRNYGGHFEKRWDEAEAWLSKMINSVTIDVLRRNLKDDGKCTSFNTDVCTFFSLAMSRCQMQASGICKCKGANMKFITLYELQGRKAALFAKQDCVKMSCVSVGPLDSRWELHRNQLATTMMRMRKCSLPVHNRADFVNAVGRRDPTYDTPAEYISSRDAFGSQMLVCKHPSVPDSSVQERLHITPKEMAECKADVKRRRQAKEQRLNALRKMVVEESLADIDAVLASRECIPVDSINELTELCEGMGTRVRHAAEENATGTGHPFDSWHVSSAVNDVEYFLDKVLAADRNMYIEEETLGDRDCSSSQAYDFVSGSDMALYDKDLKPMAIAQRPYVDGDPKDCARALHFFDNMNASSLSVHETRNRDPLPTSWRLQSGNTSQIFTTAWPCYEHLVLILSAAKKRFPRLSLLDIPKKACFTRAFTYRETVSQSSAVRKWTMQVFAKLSADPESRGIALYMIGVGPYRLARAMRHGL
jgi:hypothetical protein